MSDFYEALSYKPVKVNWDRPAIVDGEAYWMHDKEIWFIVGCHPVIQNLNIVFNQLSAWARTTEESSMVLEQKKILTQCEMNTYLRMALPKQVPSEEARDRGILNAFDVGIRPVENNPDAFRCTPEPVGV